MYNDNKSECPFCERKIKPIILNKEHTKIEYKCPICMKVWEESKGRDYTKKSRYSK